MLVCVLFASLLVVSVHGERWRVIVVTGNGSGAGTDGKVEIQVYGTGAYRSGLFEVDNEADNFERGQMDEFIVDLPPLRQPTGVEVILDDKNGKWKIHAIGLERIGQPDECKYVFKFDLWISSIPGLSMTRSCHKDKDWNEIFPSYKPQPMLSR